MALPTTVSGTVRHSSLGNHSIWYVGPFLRSDGSVVVFTAGALGSLRANYSSDPTSSWTQGSSGGLTATLHGLWTFQVGDVIHVVAQDTGDDTYYITWNADNTWGTLETIELASTQTYIGCSLAVRSNGEVIALFNGSRDAIMGTSYSRIDYARRDTSGTWQAVTPVDSAGEVHYATPIAVLGASDRVHFFWQNKDGNANFMRTLTAANSLSTVGSAISGPGNNMFAWGHGVSFVNGANTRVYAPFQGTSSIRTFLTSSADLPTLADEAAHATNDAKTTNSGSQALVCLTNDDTHVYYMYVSTTAIAFVDKVDGGSWSGTATTVKSGTFEHISANIYTRSGSKVIGYVYEESGTTKYDEYVLSAGNPPTGYWGVRAA